jgi:hypothetical protein
MRLKKQRKRLINAICGIFPTIVLFEIDGDDSKIILSISIKTKAKIRFITGPAIEIKISSRLRLEKLEGFTGTGLAHPKTIKLGLSNNIANGIKIVPKGSICTTGLIVIRPIIRAVSSPHL